MGRLPDGPATPFLGSRSIAASDATFANSAAIHSLLQDDVDLTIGHPACNVIPAALAVAEMVAAPGKDVLAAIIAGYEAMWRVGGRGAWMIPAITRGFRGNTILGASAAQRQPPACCGWVGNRPRMPLRPLPVLRRGCWRH
jgi:hypothetical protein